MSDDSVIEYEDSSDVEEVKTPNPDLKWYVVHTYSGYENKVKESLERIIETRKLQDVIPRVIIPMIEEIEVKDGKEKSALRKIFPGYVLIEMVYTKETWYVVRSIRGVTGFVGPESQPTPLSIEEVRALNVDVDDSYESTIVEGYEKGDVIEVIDGPLEGFSGVVESINFEKKCIKAVISMFGRNVSAELEYTQVRKAE
ncbi:MAG: transcription termination/antitermination factor NusG [Clostridia bacterium]|nr:transcription termination/antitermination factor NusG [Clostridia bacterium]